MENFHKELEKLDISAPKRAEVIRSKKLTANLTKIFNQTENRTKSIYLLASSIPKDLEHRLPALIKGIEKGIISSEKILKGAYEHLYENEDLEHFVENLNTEGLEQYIEILCNELKSKKEILKCINTHKKF